MSSPWARKQSTSTPSGIPSSRVGLRDVGVGQPGQCPMDQAPSPNAERACYTRIGWPAAASACLDLGDPQRTEVEHARRQHGVGPGGDRGREVLGAAGAAGGDQRDVDHGADRGDHLEVEAALGAVGVHRVEQDLPDAQLGPAAGPLDRVQPGGLTAAVGGHLEPGRLVGPAAGVHRQHQHLVAEPAGDLGDHVRAADGAGVDGHLVGAGPQQHVHVVDAETPPPTVSGMNTVSAVRRTTSSMVPRPSTEAEMSRKVSSSAPSASYAAASSTGSRRRAGRRS